MFGFSFGNSYVIKIGIIERTCLGYLFGSCERSINNKLDGSLCGISKNGVENVNLDGLLIGISLGQEDGTELVSSVKVFL